MNMIGINDSVKPISSNVFAYDTPTNGMPWQVRKQIFKFEQGGKVIEINEVNDSNDGYEYKGYEYLIEGPYKLFGWVDERDVELCH